MVFKGHPLVKEENPKVEGDDNPKGWHLKQSTFTQKATFKDPTCKEGGDKL